MMFKHVKACLSIANTWQWKTHERVCHPEMDDSRDDVLLPERLTRGILKVNSLGYLGLKHV